MNLDLGIGLGSNVPLPIVLRKMAMWVRFRVFGIAGAVAELEEMEIPMAVDINVVNARPEFQINQPLKVCSQVFEVIIAKCD